MWVTAHLIRALLIVVVQASKSFCRSFAVLVFPSPRTLNAPTGLVQINYAALDVRATLKCYHAVMAKPGVFEPGIIPREGMELGLLVVLVTKAKPVAVALATVSQLSHSALPASPTWCTYIDGQDGSGQQRRVVVTKNRAAVEITEITVPGALQQYRDSMGNPLKTMRDAQGRDNYRVLWDIDCLRRPAFHPHFEPPHVTTVAPDGTVSSRQVAWEDEQNADTEMAEMISSSGVEGGVVLEDDDSDSEETDGMLGLECRETLADCSASHGRRIKLDPKHAMSRVMDQLSKKHGCYGYCCSR